MDFFNETALQCLEEPFVPHFIVGDQRVYSLQQACKLAGVEKIGDIQYVQNSVGHRFKDFLTRDNVAMFRRFIALSKGLPYAKLAFVRMCFVPETETFAIQFKDLYDDTMYVVEFSINLDGTVVCLTCLADYDCLLPF